MPVGVGENEDVRKLVVVVDRIELLRGVMNVASQPIENRVMAQPANDFQRLRIFQLLV